MRMSVRERRDKEKEYENQDVTVVMVLPAYNIQTPDQSDSEKMLIRNYGQNPLGVYVNAAMGVTGINDISPYKEHINTGDYLISVNEEWTVAPDDICKAFEKKFTGNNCFQVVVRRSMMPPANFAYKVGFDYFIAMLTWADSGLHLGLRLKDSPDGKVYVTSVEAGSVSSLALAPQDRIIDVDNKIMSDQNLTSALIVERLRFDKVVYLSVERWRDEQKLLDRLHTDDAADNTLKTTVTGAMAGFPVEFPPDVRPIAEAEIKRRAAVTLKKKRFSDRHHSTSNSRRMSVTQRKKRATMDDPVSILRVKVPIPQMQCNAFLEQPATLPGRSGSGSDKAEPEMGKKHNVIKRLGRRLRPDPVQGLSVVESVKQNRSDPLKRNTQKVRIKKKATEVEIAADSPARAKLITIGKRHS